MIAERKIQHAAGSLLVVGLSGPELTAVERDWLRLIRPGGIILFKRNIVDLRQTRALLDEATALAAPHAVRCVDVEGGTVNRLRDALAPIPSAQAVARAEFLRPKMYFARMHGELIARAVRAFGFNTTLAPVVDLALPESAEVLGTRAPALNPVQVIRYAREFLVGLTAHHVAGCGKHFPGLGGAAGDTHFVTPEIRRESPLMWENDLLPYRTLCSRMAMIMTNHAAYPLTKGLNHPASASRFWIEAILRARIGYRGIVLSDDLEMGGILKFMPIEEAAVSAIEVGTDMLEICHSVDLIHRAWESLIAEAGRSKHFRFLLPARARRVAARRERTYGQYRPHPLWKLKFDALRDRIATFRDEIAAVTESESVAPRTVSPAENA